MTRQSREPLGTTDSVVRGLGAMLGAGLFLGLAPSAGLAGRWMLVALAIAALAAICTACSVTDLARAYPGAGGGYRYTRELLGRWPGRLAGGVSLLGRAAAIAAVAGCFGAYLLPTRPTLAALVVFVVVAVAEGLGLRPSALVNRVLVVIVLVALAIAVIACFAVPAPVQASGPLPAGLPGADNPAELLPAAGLLFFAFLGSADPGAPRRRSKVVGPVLVLVGLGVYLAVGTAGLRELGATRLALSPDPLRDVLAAADAAALQPLLSVALVAATLGVLFPLVGGLRETISAMAEAGDLPEFLGGGSAEEPRLPGLVLVMVGGAVAVVLLTPLAAIQLAATCLLFAAAFTNAAGRMLERHERVWPARTACFGLGLSVLLVVAMPPVALACAVLAMAIGAGIGPLVGLTRRRPRTPAHEPEHASTH